MSAPDASQAGNCAARIAHYTAQVIGSVTSESLCVRLANVSVK